MNYKADLAKKLRALQRRIVLAEALIRFLKKHPAVASRTLMWNLRHKPGLYFYHKAFIRPVCAKGRVTLRLERYIDASENHDQWAAMEVVSADVSQLSRKELDKVLKKVKINLKNTETEDEEALD